MTSAPTLSSGETRTTSRLFDAHEELWQEYFAGHSAEARNALVLAYRPLVTIVVKLLPRNLRAYWDQDDLETLGTFGLIDAIARWEPLARFETYAATRIRGAIYDELRRLDWLPRRLRRCVVACNKASDDLVADLGRTPANAEVLEAAGLAPGKEQVEAVDALLSSRLLSVDRGVVYGAGDEVIELVSVDESGDPELSAVRAGDLDDLRRAVLQLGQQQRTVVTLHFLLGLPQAQVAALLGVSGSRVYHIVKAGLRSLRTILGYSEVPPVRRCDRRPDH